ncbi:MAG: hypothetical protein WA001_04030 [Patescibacteria group bacterium]
MKTPIFKYAALNALGTAAYIAVVATFFANAHFLGNKAEGTVLIPMAMLLLLVVSASVTGSLVLGRPVLWYLDGKKKEAVTLLIATIGCLFVLMVVAFVAVAVYSWS